jgi:hypothetical protein
MRREHPDLLEGLIGDGGAGLVGGMMGEGITGGEGVASDGGMPGTSVANAALGQHSSHRLQENGERQVDHPIGLQELWSFAEPWPLRTALRHRAKAHRQGACTRVPVDSFLVRSALCA